MPLFKKPDEAEQHFKQAKRITIRKAMPDEAVDFADLVVLSAPSLFPILYGEKVKTIMQHLFCKSCNLFSFEHTYFAEVDGERAGMILGYDWRVKKQENWRTGFFLLMQMRLHFLSKFPLLMKVNNVIGIVSDGEYYLSNVAAYPQYRGMGIGTSLIFRLEEEAKRRGNGRVVLDVETENVSASELYKKLGYLIIKESSIQLLKNKAFHFSRMCKKIAY